MKWVIVIFCLVIGFAALFYGLKLLRIWRKVKKWNKLNAKVLVKKVIDKKLSSGSRASKTIGMEYEFQLGGQTHKGNRVFLVELLKGERGFLQRDAEKFLKRIGDQIEVHVDPNDPNNSVVYSDGGFMYFFMILAGIVILFVGLIEALVGA